MVLVIGKGAASRQWGRRCRRARTACMAPRWLSSGLGQAGAWPPVQEVNPADTESELDRARRPA